MKATIFVTADEEKINQYLHRNYSGPKFDDPYPDPKEFFESIVKEVVVAVAQEEVAHIPFKVEFGELRPYE